MAEPAYFQVRHWDRFQHYKDRSPPWIKLYTDLLDNYEFARLQDASKAHLLAIWMLASRNSNRLPLDPVWVGQRISALEPVDLDALLSAGFIEAYDAASNLLASCQQSATQRRGEESREKKRKEEPRARETDLAGTPLEAPPVGPRRNGTEHAGDTAGRVMHSLDAKRAGYRGAASRTRP
jgi:ribosomal protein L12E/L44/L45/RPP1/RPP2